ncbi:ribosome maturation factor RimM [Deinococcus yavapaiensis]|uniref:Ribosome maturation factor RimM n=1 Tax=Deinococcus yavapaiensis KR-236 TaxID=694435 RepID=A0A318S174_9DEIO|nr:ribosome maturation factor RimM [Deinococcus yavapaiensis]PYE49893.1 16S rRNA processing protein RimM [Deinococcus yavapaiensis KR-236]
MTNPDLIRVGRLLGPQGVSGGVKLFVIGSADQLLAVQRLYVDGAGWLRVKDIQQHGPGLVVFFGGVESRESAERLREKDVFASESELPALPEDEYYYHELRGMKVVTPGGETIGEVRDVQDAGAQDLLVVRHARGESFVPLQAPYVEVRRGREVVLDAPPGLLGDDADE